AGALRAAEPILDGRMTCTEVPESTYAGLVLPLIRLGKHERALQVFSAGYNLIHRKPTFVGQKASYIVGLTLTGNLDRAVRLLDRHLPEGLEVAKPSVQFEFFLAARV